MKLDSKKIFHYMENYVSILENFIKEILAFFDSRQQNRAYEEILADYSDGGRYDIRSRV